MRRRTALILLASALLVLGSCGSDELARAEREPPTDGVTHRGTRAHCRADEGATEAIFEIAPDAPGHPTPAEALRAHVAEDLPRLATAVPERLPDEATSRADDGFVLTTSTDGEATIALREGNRIVGRFHLERTASGGWIISGFEICNDAYRAAT